MTFLNKKFLIVILVATISFLIPYFIPDGLSGLSNNELAFAEFAKKAVFQGDFDSIQEIASARLRVDVETLDMQKQCLINDYNILSDRWLDGEYRAKVTAYTLFGIPIGTAWIDCKETKLK